MKLLLVLWTFGHHLDLHSSSLAFFILITAVGSKPKDWSN